MALMTISRAISANITRNVEMSELKHTAKVNDLKQSLLVQATLASKRHATTLIKANAAHDTWYATLTSAQQADFNTAQAFLEAAIAPTPTKE